MGKAVCGWRFRRDRVFPFSNGCDMTRSNSPPDLGAQLRAGDEAVLDSILRTHGPPILALLRQRKVGLLVLFDPEAGRSSGVFAGPVGRDPERWPRFLISGKAVIAAGRDLCASHFRFSPDSGHYRCVP